MWHLYNMLLKHNISRELIDFQSLLIPLVEYAITR